MARHGWITRGVAAWALAMIVVALPAAAGEANPKGLGLSKDNPVLVGRPDEDMSAYASRRYIRRLRNADGQPYKFVRVGNVGQGADGHVIDEYLLVDPAGAEKRLFIDAYHPECPPDAAPVADGFGVGPAPDGDPKDDRLPEPVQLTETHVSEDGAYTISTPEGWKTYREKDAVLAVRAPSAKGGGMRVAAYVRQMPDGGLDAAKADWEEKAEKGKLVIRHVQSSRWPDGRSRVHTLIAAPQMQKAGKPAQMRIGNLYEGGTRLYEVEIHGGQEAVFDHIRELSMIAMSFTVLP